jgi:hypothetical protein
MTGGLLDGVVGTAIPDYKIDRPYLLQKKAQPFFETIHSPFSKEWFYGKSSKEDPFTEDFPEEKAPGWKESRA